MIIQFEHDKLDQLSNEDLDELFKKSLANQSRMKWLIKNLKEGNLCWDVHIVRVYVLQQNGVIGWGFVEEDFSEDSYPIGVYVCRKYRRKGVGNSILEELIKFYGKQLIANPWDETGKNFYKKKVSVK